MNLILRPGQGEGDITQTHLQKVFDQLASSPLSYLVVDPDLQFIDYGEVSWSQVNGDLFHKFYPELLHPIHCVLEDEDLSAHLTAQGDLVFMNKDGLLAARRSASGRSTTCGPSRTAWPSAWGRPRSGPISSRSSST